MTHDDDRIALGEPHPAEKDLHPDDREDATQRRGCRSIAAGLTLSTLAILGPLATWILTEDHRSISHGGMLLLGVAAVGLVAVGAGLVVVGYLERNTRGQRAMMRLILTNQADIGTRLDTVDRIAAGGRQLREEVQDHIATVMPVLGMAMAMPGRIESLERELTERLGKLEEVIARVPSYPEAVLDGLDLARGVAGERPDKG